jgi:hypothetical protein
MRGLPTETIASKCPCSRRMKLTVDREMYQLSGLTYTADSGETNGKLGEEDVGIPVDDFARLCAL